MTATVSPIDSAVTSDLRVPLLSCFDSPSSHMIRAAAFSESPGWQVRILLLMS